MTPRVRKVLIAGGYVGFYVVALVAAFCLTFPYARLKERILGDFNQRQQGPDAMRLEIDEIDSYWLSGVEAEGVRLVSKGEPEAPGKPAKSKVTSIDHAHARLALLSLLIGRRVVNFGAEAFGGTLSGSLKDSEAERVVSIEIDGLDLGQTPLFAGLVGLPVTGNMGGSIELVAPEGRLSKAEGKLALKIAGVTVGDGKAKIRDLIALPKLEAGELTLDAEVKAGQVKDLRFGANGPDLEFSTEGSVRLRDQPEQSLLNLTAEFKFTERYTSKDDLTKAIFGPSGMFDLDPKNRRAKRPDGFYGWRVSGSLAHPTFAPNPTPRAKKP